MISVIRAFQYVCDGMQIIWAQMLIPYDKNMEVWSMDLTLSRPTIDNSDNEQIVNWFL